MGILESLYPQKKAEKKVETDLQYNWYPQVPLGGIDLTNARTERSKAAASKTLSLERVCGTMGKVLQALLFDRLMKYLVAWTDGRGLFGKALLSNSA